MYQTYLPNYGYLPKRQSRHSRLVNSYNLLSDKVQDLQTELTELDVKVSELEDTVNNLGKSDMFHDATNFKSLTLENLTYLLYNTYCQGVGNKSYDGKDLPSAYEFFHDPSKVKQAAAWKAVGALVHNNIQE